MAGVGVWLGYRGIYRYKPRRVHDVQPAMAMMNKMSPDWRGTKNPAEKRNSNIGRRFLYVSLVYFFIYYICDIIILYSIILFVMVVSKLQR